MRSLLLVTLIVLILAGWIFTRHHVDGLLLRADPDTLPENGSLFATGIARGTPVFSAHCAECHGADGGGDSAQGIPDLTDSDWLYGAGQVSDIEQVITYGIRAKDPRGWNLAIMPAYAQGRPSSTNEKILPLSPADISDLIEMLYQQQGRAADATAAARGVELYNGRGGCYDCHASDMKGDSAIGAPDLTDRINLYGDGSKSALFDTIAKGRQGVCPAWIGKISAVGIRATALYVYSLSHSGMPAHVSP